MMISKSICHYLHVILMAIIFSPITLAPWTFDNLPKTPDDGAEMHCANWIYFFGFNDDNYKENSKMANERESALDKIVSVWAVRYAYLISGPPKNKHDILPQDFCNSQGMINDIIVTFTPLKDEARTCEEWIYFYGYTPSLTNDRIANMVNWDKAEGRNIKMDGNISIWAAMYSQLMYTLKRSDAISPSAFCFQIGKTSIPKRRMPFMTLNETKLTCEDWIKLYDYTDDVNANFTKARLELYLPHIHSYVQIWASTYTVELYFKNLTNTVAVTPRIFCLKNGQDDDEKYYFVPQV